MLTSHLSGVLLSRQDSLCRRHLAPLLHPCSFCRKRQRDARGNSNTVRAPIRNSYRQLDRVQSTIVYYTAFLAPPPPSLAARARGLARACVILGPYCSYRPSAFKPYQVVALRIIIPSGKCLGFVWGELLEVTVMIYS